MKQSPLKIILLILACVGLLGAIQAVWFSGGKNNFEKTLETTRQDLRRQGFKTDLSEFDFSTTPELRRREAALTFFSTTVHPAQPEEQIKLSQPVGENSALVIWKQDWLKTESDPTDWNQLRESMAAINPLLDDACDAALSGPIRFDLDTSKGSSMLLRHLAPLKHLSQSLGSRAFLELHDGHVDAAWTNLLAQSRLVTAWATEPVEVSQLVRFALTRIAFDTTWQALQFDHWPDEKLAALQHEWQSVNFFTNLPETAAFQRASVVQMCERNRKEPVLDVPLSEFAKEAARAPAEAWRSGKFLWELKRYQTGGVFDDERRLLLHYQQRELELRRAITAPDWSEMQALPGVTNLVLFVSHNMRMQSLFNMRLTGMAMQLRGSILLGRAAEAETRRRLIITASALERFHNQHGAYPKSLSELPQNLLPVPAVDFMDGQLLRYQLKSDGHFLLYSTGLDCADNGGKMRDPKRRDPFDDGTDFMGQPREPDIVWPRPATDAEAAHWHQEQLATLQNQADKMEELQADAQWQHTASHQADADKVLANTNLEILPDKIFHGRPLSKTLQNPQSSGTNKLSLTEMLTLKPVITGGEPETITFELPMDYDVVTNLGSLCLMLDTNNDDWDGGCHAQQVECERNETNGNALLIWSTIYESPGLHAVQAGLTVDELPSDRQDFYGPYLAHTVTNLCQFSLGSSTYDVKRGATFHARLPEANGNYSVECLTTNCVHLKTLSGSTTNGQFKSVWNLVDDHGHRLTGETFNSIVHLTLPDSGRTQTLRGP